MRRMTLTALALVGSLGITGIARAGCCDDFWSCGAAFLSGGLTCQIQGIIDTVNSMKQLVENLTNTLRTQTNTIVAQQRQAVNDATNDFRQLREKAVADLQKHADQAHEIATPKMVALAPVLAGGLKKSDMAVKPLGMAPGTLPAGALQASPVTATSPAAAGNANAAALPKSGDPQAIKDALLRAEAMAKDFQSKATGPAQQVAQAEAAALSAVARHVNTAMQISLDLALAPLNMLRDTLLNLLSHPEAIFDPSAAINAQIQAINNQVPAMFVRITNEVNQEALGDLNQIRGTLQQLQDSATAGQTLVDAMQKVANSKLQTDLEALERIVPKPAAAPPPPPGGVASQAAGPAIMISPTMMATLLPPAIAANNRQLIAVAITRADAAKLPILVQQHAVLADLGSKWQALQSQIKTPVRVEPAIVQKVDQNFAQMFAGKSRGEVEKKKNELLEEANKRFAKDPKMLQKMRELIESRAPKG